MKQKPHELGLGTLVTHFTEMDNAHEPMLLPFTRHPPLRSRMCRLAPTFLQVKIKVSATPAPTIPMRASLQGNWLLSKAWTCSAEPSQRS